MDYVVICLAFTCSGLFIVMILVVLGAGIRFTFVRLRKKVSGIKQFNTTNQIETEPKVDQQFIEEDLREPVEKLPVEVAPTVPKMKSEMPKTFSRNKDDVQEIASELTTKVPAAVPKMKSEMPKTFSRNKDDVQEIASELTTKVPAAVPKMKREMPKIFSSIKDWFLFRKQASLDYQAARGTQHLKVIESCMPNLKKQIGRIQSEVAGFERQLTKLDQERQRQLSKLLSDYLISAKLVEVSGVGPKLASQIKNRVYKGKLRDLHRASSYVRGIGQSKQIDISAWVRRMENQFTQLLKQNFPGKEKYLEGVRSKQRVLEINLKTSKEDLKTAQELRLVVDKALTDLKMVSQKDYLRSLQGEHNEAISQHSLGVFAPWESPPLWFKKLLNEYGE